MLKKAARFAFAEGGSVKARVLRSGVWVGLSEIGLSVFGVIRSVALARLLSPEIFGLMALALVLVRTIETFTRPGVTQALIARPDGFAEASPTAFSLLVARGFLLALLLAAAAPWIGAFYEAEQLVSVLQVLSMVFMVGSFVNINTIAKQRDLDFRRLSYMAQVTALLGTLATIAAAYWWRSVWALVIGQLVAAGLTAILSYVFVPGRVRFGFSKDVARELLSYGKFITGSSILLFLATEIDSAVIGKVLDPRQLGFYTVAFSVAHLVTTNLSKMAAKIMMPAYSRLQGDREALRRAYLRSLEFLSLAVVPATIGLIVVAEPLLRVVYGEQWLPAAVPMVVLAIFGLVRAIAAFAGYLFEGIGQPGVAFRLAAVRLAVVLPAIVPATLYFGLLGAAITVTAGMAAQWLAGFPHLREHLSVTVGQVLGTLWRPLWTSALMAAAAAGMMAVLDADRVLGLLATVLVAAGVYGLLNLRLLLALRRQKLV
jgi:O-antigen/teichoic acid export membrane protein